VVRPILVEDDYLIDRRWRISRPEGSASYRDAVSSGDERGCDGPHMYGGPLSAEQRDARIGADVDDPHAAGTD
jgi:hypothetical protein